MLDPQSLQLVFQLSVSFLAAILLFYFLFQGIKNQDKVLLFVQKLNLVYVWFIASIIIVISYHKQLHDLVTDPPKYIFVLAAFTWLLTFIGNIYKEKLEGQKMLTEAIKLSLEGKFFDLDKKVEKLEGRFDILEGRFDILETEVHVIKTTTDSILLLLQNMNQNNNP
jgi:hypothetical protein